VAAVMLDGGRYQVRAQDQGPGVVDAAWKETKVACCQTLSSAEAAQDPQPQPPRKFLEPTAVARLVATMKTRQAAGRSEKPATAAAAVEPGPAGTIDSDSSSPSLTVHPQAEGAWPLRLTHLRRVA
jgi:hypothetical protein